MKQFSSNMVLRYIRTPSSSWKGRDWKKRTVKLKHSEDLQVTAWSWGGSWSFRGMAVWMWESGGWCPADSVGTEPAVQPPSNHGFQTGKCTPGSVRWSCTLLFCAGLIVKDHNRCIFFIRCCFHGNISTLTLLEKNLYFLKAGINLIWCMTGSIKIQQKLGLLIAKLD